MTLQASEATGACQVLQTVVGREYWNVEVLSQIANGCGEFNTGGYQMLLGDCCVLQAVWGDVVGTCGEC